MLSGKWMISEELVSQYHLLLQNYLNGVVSEEAPEPISIYGSTGNTEIVALDKASNYSNKDSYVAVVPIKTPIFKYSQNCGPTGTKDYMKIIDAFYNDPNCIKSVIDWDSNGGQVAGTPEFHDFLFMRRDKIESYSDGNICSAAYYAAAATSKITINKRADKMGSLGCMVMGLDFSEKLAKDGIKEIILYGTKSTAKNDTTRQLKEGNTQYFITKEIDPMVDDFHIDVTAARPSINKDVFDGRAVRPDEALKLGLVDEFGTLEGVINRIYAEHKQNSNNSNLNMKMSNHAKVMAVIGVATLAIADDKGTYFNEEHLQSMEDALTANETEKETLTANLQTANDAKATAEANLQTEKTAHATSLQNIASALGLPATATAEDINARISALKPAHTNPTGTEKPKEEGKSGFNPNAAHNLLANQINS